MPATRTRSIVLAVPKSTSKPLVGLGRRDRQDPAVAPAGLLAPLHEQVWDRPAGRVEQAEVVQAAFGDHRLAALRSLGMVIPRRGA